MRPVSPSFLAALTRSHSLAVDAALLFGGIPQPVDLEIVGGTVTLDRTAEIRGRCDLTLNAEGLIPTSAFSPVTPFGAELQIFRGIDLSTGPEFVSLGIFGIQDVTTDDLGATLQITGLDRAQAVKDADFEATFAVRAGTNYADAIRDVIAGGVTGLTYLFAPTDAVTPLIVFADGDGRWQAAQDMAVAIGCDLYFDGDGRCVLEPVPDPQSDPVVALNDGPEGVLVSAPKRWTRDGCYNAVVAVSSNPNGSGNPARAVVRDLDPQSPTYYFGPYGKKPIHYSSPLITLTPQAVNAASGLLRKSLGVAQSLDLAFVPNPALEPGDIVSVRRTALGIDEVDVLDSVVISLDTTAMTAGVRARQVQ